MFLTSTMQLGRVYDAACELLIAEDPGIGTDDVIIPIVAECDDSFLNDARRMQVTAEDVGAALVAARASVGGTAPAEGAVGAGTGMSCLGFKGGIGTASRLTPSGHTVGVLLLSNFGERERLTVDGVPVGRLLPAPATSPRRHATAGGLVHRGRRDRRSARLGGMRPAGPPGRSRPGQDRLDRAAHGSGEIFLAMATGLARPTEPTERGGDRPALEERGGGADGTGA